VIPLQIGLASDQSPSAAVESADVEALLFSSLFQHTQKNKNMATCVNVKGTTWLDRVGNRLLHL